GQCLEMKIDGARADGASEWQVGWDITLPLARRGILAGLILSAARALGEFGATIIFAGNLPGRTQTMPLAIYLGFERDLNLALILSLILLAISFVVLAVVKGALRQRIGVQ
ncbi:MAG TPA: ABC transporter permease subunit, partial [Roseiflexaceae bacterium]|nr:ABC transporter permease subunit [Roseiflexaceae bacterium]